MVKAINTIEILEHVCTFLAPIDVLQLQLVNKEWRSLVVHSPQLSPHLFVEAQWSHSAINFQLLLLVIPGLQIRRDDSVHLGQWVEVRMSLAAAKEILATAKKNKISSLRPIPPILMLQPNSADLFITQPPLKGMQAFLVGSHDVTLETACSGNRQTVAPEAHAKISCDAGITLGFLAEVAEWMFGKRERLLQDENHQDKEAVFRAIVSYCVQSDAAPRMRSATRTVTEIESLQ
jgi:hypothetical protein